MRSIILLSNTGSLSFVILLLVGCQPSPSQPRTSIQPAIETEKPTLVPTTTPMPWNLVWSDEFNGSDIDRNKWTFDIGGSGWGNAEKEFYTERTENARVEGGFLVIEAREEKRQGHSYTSARLKTQGLNTWTYGRIEARIKIPYGQGIWPAFWMLGENINQAGWPACGEIDILENIGKEPNIVHGTVHGPGYSGAGGVGAAFELDCGRFADDFHIYTVEWGSNQIRWYVEGELFLTITPNDVSGEWVFDHPFFLIINVAVGGRWPGYPDDTTSFPQFMYVDYVRVYQR